MRDNKNLINFSAEDILMFLNNAQKILAEKYGLVVDFSHSKIKEVELNTTFALNNTFTEYYRPLSVIFSLMPYLKKDCEYRCKNQDKKELESISAFNQQISATAYNKTIEMSVNIGSRDTITIVDSNGQIVQEDMMRIEYKLKNAAVCKKWFRGSNSIAELTQAKIDEVFGDLTEYYVFSPIEKWRINNRSFLNDLVKKAIKSAAKGKHWKGKLLNELRNIELVNHKVALLDINDLYSILKKYPDKYRHVQRRTQGFSFAENDVFLQNDGEKLEEIITSLEYCMCIHVI